VPVWRPPDRIDHVIPSVNCTASRARTILARKWPSERAMHKILQRLGETKIVDVETVGAMMP